MLKRITTLVAMSGLFSACSYLKTSVVYTDNSTCTESMVNGALNIAWEDYKLDKKYKKLFFDKGSKKFITHFQNRQMAGFYIFFKPKFFKDLNITKEVKKRTYFYYIQKNGNECRANLYKKEVESKDYSFYSIYSGAILTLDSYKLNLCNCSENNVEMGF